MRWGALIALSLAVSPVQAVAKSVYKEFAELLLERDNRYVEEARAAADRNNAAVDAFKDTVAKQGPDGGEKLIAVLDAAQAYGYANGRGETLRDFRMHMEKKPSLQRTDFWLQEKLDAVKLASAQVQKNEQAIKEMQGAKAEPVKVLNAMEQNRRAMGEAMGQIDELMLINRNSATYYQAKNEETQRRMAAWQAISQSLQAAAANKPKFTNCTTNGPFTNCMTN